MGKVTIVFPGVTAAIPHCRHRQWGYQSAGYKQGILYAFPISFTTVCYSVVNSMSNSDSGNAYWYITKPTITGYSYSSTDTGNWYIAVGR
jgi:hypothetical protein